MQALTRRHAHCGPGDGGNNNTDKNDQPPPSPDDNDSEAADAPAPDTPEEDYSDNGGDNGALLGSADSRPPRRRQQP